MKARIAAGMVAGLVALWGSFYLQMFLLALAWPALAEVGRRALEVSDYTGLTPAMLVILLLFWCIAYLAAGWVTQRISRGRLFVMLMATPQFLMAAYNHFHAMWELFPAWYNLGVVLCIYPLALLGAGIASASPAAARASVGTNT